MDSIAVDCPPGRQSRFEFAAPRRFLLPAVLMLVAEEPRHGYMLTKDLQKLRLGRVDRPSVYRALGQLEGDGLVTSFASTPSAGHARRSYRITAEGERVLRQWMGVIKDERDGLDKVLRRYVATESVDARVAEVTGGWQRVTAPLISPVAPSTGIDAVAGRQRWPGVSLADVSETDAAATVGHYRVVPDRSVVLIDARSSVGPITFGAIGLEGQINVAMVGGRIRPDADACAHLEVAVEQLHSGNRLYDAELIRRIDGRRFPRVDLDLRECQPVGSTGRFQLQGDVKFHGETRRLRGTVELSQSSERTIVIRGEHIVDIRDFGVESPTVLMLRIYPDVLVKIQIEAELSDEERPCACC